MRLQVSEPQVLSLALWAAVCACSSRGRGADKVALGALDLQLFMHKAVAGGGTADYAKE